MAALCICGVCIPYSALLPLLFFLLQPVLNFFKKLFGFKVDEKETKKGVVCEGGVCKFDNGEASTATAAPSCCSTKTDTAEEQSTNNTTKTTSEEIVDEAQVRWLRPEENLDTTLARNSQILMRFTAKWCKPCKEIEPYYFSFTESHKNISFISVDVDDCNEVFEKLGGLSIPLFIAFNQGEVVDKVTGNNEAKLKALIERLSRMQ